MNNQQQTSPRKVRFPIIVVVAGFLSLPFWYWRAVQQGYDPRLAFWCIIATAIIMVPTVYVAWKLALRRQRPRR
jgi:ABC-type spermidine/putrescine transport system permease subunit II